MDAGQGNSLSEGLVIRVKVDSIRITRIRRASDLDVHLDAWRDLAAGVPMRSPEWFLAWWQHYATTSDELCILLFHEPRGLLVGLAPLYLHSAGKRTTVRLLGSGVASTNHTTWLAAPGWETPVSDGVARFLLDSTPGWNEVHLEWVDVGDPTINATVTCLQENGCLLRKTPRRHSCWEIALPATWDEYLKMLSKSHRKQCRKLQDAFFESGRVRVHHAESETDFRKGFEILLQLHAARWGKPSKPLGFFSDSTFRAFHESVARELLDRKQLLLMWLEFNGKPVTVEYQFIGRKTVYSYLAGMDSSVSAFAPGNLSIMASIQYAIEQGCESFDLSRGDQPYKANWRATPTACHDIRIWQNHFFGRLAHGLWGVRNLGVHARKLAGRWIKSRVPPRVIDSGLSLLHLRRKRRQTTQRPFHD